MEQPSLTASATVTSVASMGLQNLSAEPSRLSEDAERCNVELEKLVINNYRVFVENLTCHTELKVEDQKMGKVTDELCGKLNDLSEDCFSFRDRVSSLISSHRRNRKTLQHHMQLVELLEVPQLVDACTRNGFHDEALELAHFVNGLERRHLLSEELKRDERTLHVSSLHWEKDVVEYDAESDVIRSIVADVNNSLVGLRRNLISVLAQHSSLPKELQTLALLRKLDGQLIDRQLVLERHRDEATSRLSDQQRDRLRSHLIGNCETRLQMEFLEARSLLIEREYAQGINRARENGSSNIEHSNVAAVGAVPSGAGLGTYGKAVELLEASRSSWFAVVTQFNALFSSNNIATSGAITGDFYAYPSVAILSAWVGSQTEQLLTDLEVLCLQIEEGAALRAVLEQALFLGERMGKVQCDFSVAVVQLFHKLLTQRIKQDLQAALSHFRTMLQRERFSASAHGISNMNEDCTYEQIVPLYVRHDPISSIGITPGGIAQKRGNKEVMAPQVLTEFPPLAYLLNSFLHALNLLRECPLASLRGDVLLTIRGVMLAASEIFVKEAAGLREKGERYLAHGVGENKEDHGEQNKTKMDEMYAEAIGCELFPHIVLCLDSVFQEPHISLNSSSTTEKNLKIQSLTDLQSIVSKESYQVLSTSWNIIKASGLLS